MLDDVRKNVRRAALALVACFGLIAIALGYWQLWRAADLGQDPANPRVADERLSQPRGRILDRNGQVLADTESTPHSTRRQYSDPSLVHTIGFHSDRFGDTNLEAAYDAELRGERSQQLPGSCRDRKSTRLNSSHVAISYAVFCLKKKKKKTNNKLETTNA